MSQRGRRTDRECAALLQRNNLDPRKVKQQLAERGRIAEWEDAIACGEQLTLETACGSKVLEAALYDLDSRFDQLDPWLKRTFLEQYLDAPSEVLLFCQGSKSLLEFCQGAEQEPLWQEQAGALLGQRVDTLEAFNAEYGGQAACWFEAWQRAAEIRQAAAELVNILVDDYEMIAGDRPFLGNLFGGLTEEPTAPAAKKAQVEAILHQPLTLYCEDISDQFADRSERERLIARLREIAASKLVPGFRLLRSRKPPLAEWLPETLQQRQLPDWLNQC